MHLQLCLLLGLSVPLEDCMRVDQHLHLQAYASCSSGSIKPFRLAKRLVSSVHVKFKL